CHGLTFERSAVGVRLTKISVEPVVAPSPVRRQGLRLWLTVAAAVVALAAGGFVTFRLTSTVPAPQIKQTLPQTYTIPGATSMRRCARS
ncbi:hypothetical protein AB0H83_47120, partial [Dactylosporangium sp. NPDC050688]|uniref:hypothetical protein n=1 Tax=Dactylosporangium sp. NPDC050688 TaxID=3157217 RepID=UPI0033C33E08